MWGMLEAVSYNINVLVGHAHFILGVSFAVSTNLCHQMTVGVDYIAQVFRLFGLHSLVPCGCR